jgi:AraC-like DNA-binding protein
MDDLASTLVLAMIRRTLAVQGLELPVAPVKASSRLLPLVEKRSLLEVVLARDGPVAILRVAGIVEEFADHPVTNVFAGCRTGQDAIGRWQSIERYFHSRHRTRICNQSVRAVEMQHVDTHRGVISPGEDLAVAGLVVGILRWTGARRLRLCIGDWVAFDGDFTPAPESLGRTDRWTIGWEHFVPAGRTHLSDATVLPKVDHAGRTTDDPLVAGLLADVMSMPGARRSVEGSARKHCLSARTLQRRLRAAGWTFGDVVSSARVHVAARLLAETQTPLALVGLFAGYSDQPHFQRAFRDAVGPTPAEYRRLAATGDLDAGPVAARVTPG